MGSNPTRCATSEQATYRLLRLFQKSECAHCAAPPFQIEPASLGFDLVLGAISKGNRFDPLIATCVDKKYAQQKRRMKMRCFLCQYEKAEKIYAGKLKSKI